MAIRQQLDDDLKAAMLGGDAIRKETLRGLKSAILYADVAAKKRDTGGVSDDEVLTILAKESKKRQESADLYVQGGSQERADKELVEKSIIDSYLPEQLTDQELIDLVDVIITEQGAEGVQAMGKVIGAVKAKVGTSADGSRVARIVKGRLSL